MNGSKREFGLLAVRVLTVVVEGHTREKQTASAARACLFEKEALECARRRLTSFCLRETGLKREIHHTFLQNLLQDQLWLCSDMAPSSSCGRVGAALNPTRFPNLCMKKQKCFLKCGLLTHPCGSSDSACWLFLRLKCLKLHFMTIFWSAPPGLCCCRTGVTKPEQF